MYPLAHTIHSYEGSFETDPCFRCAVHAFAACDKVLGMVVEFIHYCTFHPSQKNIPSVPIFSDDKVQSIFNYLEDIFK